VITNDELLKEIASLPAEAKRQIERFVALLKERQITQADSTPAKPLLEEEFVGMWADRKPPPRSPAR
jgi:hypothetical protein